MSSSANTRNAADLTRDAVIDAAAELVAERGYGDLNMRALAERCGVATMTLYRHVRTKEDLMGALADRFVGELDLPAPGELSWQEEIASVFRSMHRLLLEHPELAEIAGRQHVAGEAAYRGAEVVLGALRRAGIDGEAAASAFGTLVAFTVGFAQQQIHSSARERLSERLAVIERLPSDDYENVSRLGGLLLMRHSDRHFEDGLDVIIRGLASKAGA